jgi:hypothetical protein
MDRYDHVIRDIQEQTEAGALRWQSVPPLTYQGYPLDSNRASRVYYTQYSLGDKQYGLAFVEAKAAHFDEDTESTSGRRVFEVVVLGLDGVALLRLYEGAVDREDLSKLAALIEERDDRVSGFFDAFEKARGVGSRGA